MNTPLMRQYQEIKNKFPDTLVLFQVGDFYELFFEDAKKAAAFLGITLTKRGIHNQEPIPLCGVPVHTVDHYLLKLVKGGFRVAVCDQLTPAVPGRIVERGVRQVLTPGTLTDAKLLPEKSASYIATVFPIAQMVGLVFAELLTGQVFLTVLTREEEKLYEAELARFSPDEIIVPHIPLGQNCELQLKKWGYITTLQSWSLATFDHSSFTQWLAGQSILPFIEQSESIRQALMLLYNYFLTHQPHALTHLRHFFVYTADDYLLLDAATLRNLEIIHNSQGTGAHTLFSILDCAVTAMGSRTIKKWITRPLTKKELIEQRLDIVEQLVHNRSLLVQLQELLKEIGDVERIVGRLALQRASLSDYTHLKNALAVLPYIREILQNFSVFPLGQLLYERLASFNELNIFLEQALNDDPTQEWLIKRGFNNELDRLRGLVDASTSAVLALEKQEQEATGISSLKIRHNQVHGYGIEVTKTNLSLVPPHYIRLQTLLNRERFTTQTLKDLEYDCARAQKDSKALEKELFEQIVKAVEKEISSLKKMAQVMAHLDALTSFAYRAYEHQYIRPRIDISHDINIKQGKHPVVLNELHHAFVPNDLILTEQQPLWIITGPNMGGKSTFLRQAALLIIMAQAGSFIPAHSAQLPLIDRIFTRIGAADNVSQGKSTFLVEMEETALICHQATQHSLVILDEVGRGTSTYDGLAIAQAVIEYIYTYTKARCLFATHYHELTTLATNYPGIGVYHAASQQTEKGIVLLHKILPGSSNASFGIEVARMAHLPEIIIKRAEEITEFLKQPRRSELTNSSSEELYGAQQQLTALTHQLTHLKQIVNQLKPINYDLLSPKQAFDILWNIKSLL